MKQTSATGRSPGGQRGNLVAKLSRLFASITLAALIAGVAIASNPVTAAAAMIHGT